MFTIKKIILFVFTFGFVSQNTFSQEIRDDTIYTSLGAETYLFFHDKITFCDYANPTAYLEYNKKQADDKSVSIRAKVENASPVRLTVTEGKRTHSFILTYKEKLSSQQLDHDFEDLKVLQKYVTAKSIAPKPDKDPPSGRDNSVAITTKSSAPNNNNVSGLPSSSQKNPPSETIPAKRKEEVKEDYNSILLKAFTLFENKKYSESRELYQNAADLRPEEKIARNKIAEIDMIQNGIAKEKEYKENLAAADKAFSDKNFEEAKGLYILVSGIRQNDPYAKRKIVECQQILDKAVATRKSRENDEAFQKSVIAGKKALEENRLQDAKAAFSLALDLKPADQYSKDQIKLVDGRLRDIQSQQDEARLKAEREAVFNEALTNGNEAFNNRNFTAALSEYKKAKAIKDVPYISDQLKKINQIIADSAQRVASEQATIAREKQNTEVYNKYIKKGDQAFEMKKYAEAKNNFQQALNYKKDQYAEDKLAAIKTIEAKAAEENELKKKYDGAVSKGKSAMANNDVNKAKTFFEEAVTLKPDDAFAKTQLDIIYKKLDEITKQKELDDRYDTCLDRGAQAVLSQEYKKARDYYKEAGQLKPRENYPVKMIMYIDGVLLDIAEMQKREETFKQRRQIIALKEDANTAIVDKRWKDALQKYQEVLALNPVAVEKEFASQKIIAIETEIRKVDSLNAVKTPVAVKPSKPQKDQKERNAIFEAQRQKQEKIRQDTIAAQIRRLEALKKQPSPVFAAKPHTDNNTNSYANPFLQNEAIPYQHQELIKKYPDINFEEPPAGQTYDPSDRKNRAVNFEISKKILTDTSSLNLSDSINYIKAICKSISFNGSNAFIKILIRNNSLSDFLTGGIQMKVIKKNKTIIELNQRFISDFPIVLPQKEFPVVYVADGSLTIEPTDTLIMEIRDRSNKTKLKINIPAVLYNMGRTAKL